MPRSESSPLSGRAVLGYLLVILVVAAVVGAMLLLAGDPIGARFLYMRPGH